jgi:thiol-disulfide isomerase/thioredoxin
MRSPTVLGVVAALATGTFVIVVLLGLALGQEPTAPTPRAPTAQPITSPTPAAAATTTPGPTLGSPDAGSPGLFTLPPEGPAVGQHGPPIELPALGGGTLDTSDYAGSPLWINFMATWCPQCVDELPMMVSMQAQLEDQISIVLVDVEEDEQTVRQFLDSLGVDFPTGLDEDGAAQEDWAAHALPVHYWLDAEGVVQYVLFGGAPRDLFIEGVRSVIPEAESE